MTALRRDRGATIPIVALLLPVLILMTAFAVDLGRQRSSRRSMQAAADVIALDMVRQTGTLTWPAIQTDPTVLAALADSESRNGIAPGKVSIEWGTWDETNGYVACTIVTDCHPFPDNGPPTAVKVTTRENTDYYFQPGSGDVERTAIAAQSKRAAAVVGSKVASINTNVTTQFPNLFSLPLVNRVFGRVLNNNVDLSAVSYDGLLGATVPVGPLAAQMGFASPDALADSTVNARNFYLATATVMQNQGNTAAATALQSIASQTSSSLTFDAGQLMEIEQGGDEAAANASVDLWSLVSGSVFAINGTNTLSVPNANVSLPNVASTNLSLHVTQRPVLFAGPEGAQGFTNQVSITATPTVNMTLPVAGLANVTVTGTVPVTASVGGATGTISQINCGAQTLTVGVAPQLISATTSVNLALSVRVTILNIPGSVTLAGVTTQSNGTANSGTFAYTSQFLPQIGTGTMKPAPSTSIGLSGAVTVNSGSNVTVAGLSAPLLAGLTNALNNLLLAPLLTAVDSLLVNQLPSLLGLNVGGAAIGASDMTCKGVKLVG